MIIEEYDKSNFISAFHTNGFKNQFSKTGLNLLWEIVNDMYEDEYYILDIQSLTIEYKEYKDIESLRKEYSDVDYENNLIDEDFLHILGQSRGVYSDNNGTYIISSS